MNYSDYATNLIQNVMESMPNINEKVNYLAKRHLNEAIQRSRLGAWRDVESYVIDSLFEYNKTELAKQFHEKYGYFSYEDIKCEIMQNTLYQNKKRIESFLKDFKRKSLAIYKEENL